MATSNTINLQIPKLDKDIKEKVEALVREEGFSSLQDYLRVFLTRLAKGKISIDETLDRSVIAGGGIDFLNQEMQSELDRLEGIIGDSEKNDY
ncbi:MAG: hypothetical protein ACOCXT_05140 [Candidatus Dojkabacteria bacterium]